MGRILVTYSSLASLSSFIYFKTYSFEPIMSQQCMLSNICLYLSSVHKDNSHVILTKPQVVTFHSKMLELPGHVLNKLQCVQCGGYLSCGPLVINEKNEQLCGRCFKILPDEIRSHCRRQTGLEAVAEVLLFPCRYNTQGCTYTFPFNKGTSHEVACLHRYNSLPFMQETNNNTLRSQCEEIEVKVLCLGTYNVDEKCKLNVEILPKSGNRLCVNDESVKIGVEIAVALDVVPEVTYSYASIEKYVDEPLYDSVSCVSHDVKCANCQKSVLTSEVYHCGFGHPLCKFCKSSSCQICGVLPNSSSQHYCKNYHRGCRNLFDTSDITKHEIDCEFNDFKCRLCEFCDSLNILVEHFVHSHNCVVSNELTVSLTKKDKDWYFYCYSRIFHCKYYYFDDKIEFVLTYIGSNDNAASHKYEVTLLSEFFKNLTKSARCLGWNEVSLDKGVSFELKSNSLKNLQVRVTIL